MTKLLSTSDLRTDGGTQMRLEIDYLAVDDYAAAFSAGTALPPLVVFHDGSANWLADGFHRWHAARKAGLEMVECDVRQGSQRDAVFYAVSANDTNGLRRKPADKRVAVLTLLNDSEWSARTDKWIADAAKVSRPFVAEQRKQVGKCNVALCEDGQVERRVGRDGKKRRVKRKSTVPPHVPPIDSDEPPVKKTELAATSDKPVTASRSKDYGDFFDEEREWVQLAAALAERMRKRHSKADIDRGRYVHELNTMANDIAEAIEEAEAK